MSKFTTNQLIETFTALSKQFENPTGHLAHVVSTEHSHNAWFTQASVEKALKAIAAMLNPGDMKQWLSDYDLQKNTTLKKVGLILAGNIPLVGFHDVLCVLASGNHALIKAATQDARLIKAVLELLVDIEPAFVDSFTFVDRLEGFDAIIATGSNNSSRYFDYYFSKVPNIIRKNRNSVAVITGDETEYELFQLGHDIFDYYGLGCRNVSKIMVPRDYDLATFFEAIMPFQPIINHHKYNNNYDYNKSIYLVNSDKHFDNGFLLLKEDERLASPLAVLYFSYYDDLKAAQQFIETEKDNIQCVVSKASLNVSTQVVGPGGSQQPKLWDYADGIDTMEFLSNL